ncbi:hypothetical protein JVU11DRAFT_758 [Chiua virens]|nr:hypothetical protein JVU11DRAFT_758 [Chiua virens]
MDSDPLDNPRSQPSQILQHALAPVVQNQEPSTNLNLANDGINSIHDFSLDSAIIPARPVTPRYHLPVSAWQSPQEIISCTSGDCASAEDSQKENRQENGELGPSAPSPASPCNVSLQGSRSEPFILHGDTPFSVSAGKVIATRSASFLPPSTTPGAHPFPRPTNSMPVGNRQYRRSPSLPSQDSFGGPVTQDPAEQYLASAKPFQMPLSDLGATPTQEVIHSPANLAETLPDASEYNEIVEAVVRDYEEQLANGAPSIPSRILVAATPNDSGEYSASSQHKIEDFSLQEQRSRFEFNRSSSFDKMLERDLCDAPDPTPGPAQLQETGPLQADGLPDVDPPTGDDILTTSQLTGEQTSLPFDWIAPIPRATVPPSNPRSLLSTVHPDNRYYRLAKMQALAGDVGPNSRVTGTETQPSHIEETQPCHDDEPTSSNVPPPAQPLRRIYIPVSPSTRHQPDEENVDGGPGDALDIVPDSEPLRVGSSAQSCNHHRAVTQSPLKKPFSPLSPMSEDGSGDIVLDSLEVEGSEADIPLATERFEVTTENKTTHDRNTKGATSAVPTKPRKPSSSSTTEKSSRPKPSKMEYTEVPTSLPDQDLQCQTFSSRPLLAATTETLLSNKKGRGPRSEPRARPTSTTCLPATNTAGNKRSHQSDTESLGDSSGDEKIMPPRVLKEEEEETVSADDCDLESPPPPLKSDTLRKKRRRIEDANPSRGTSKATNSTRNKRSETPAVATRSARRLRSGVSSVRGLSAGAATRVFALWKQDGHYYSGVVYCFGKKNKYTIKFDDGTRDDVEVKNLRRRELVVGDRVILVNENVTAAVRDISRADSHGIFTLAIDDGEEVTTREVQFSGIRLANRTIQSQWKERMVAAENIVTVVQPKPVVEATPSRQSVASTTPGKVQRELVKTGFTVTISPKNAIASRTKDEAMRAIKQRGGQVIEDWSSVFTMEGKHSQSNKRWTATSQDFRWKPDVNLDRVFLLSDDAHQKPKFLLALALGIPCLSFEWLSKEGELSSDWQPYLLPAGYSDSLCARLSQLVDLDWGNCTEHLTDIMANQVPMKLFSGKTVLCVGTELVPLPPIRANKNASDEASRYVPWIILCMGANKVEAITDIKQLSASLMETFDYVIVRERGLLGNAKFGKRPVVGDVDWVKQCLVSSRLSDPE